MLGANRGFLRINSTVKVTFDGNSLVHGLFDGTPTFPDQTMLLPPLKGSGASYVNLGIGGQSTRQMNGLDGGSSADVDASWDATKTNILVIWEATNSIAFYGRTVAQGVGDMIAYITARKSLHPWRVVMLTTIPRYQMGNDAQLVQWNQIARNNYRAWGVDVLVDVRAPGSVFNFDGTVAANFQATQLLWNTPDTWVHLSDQGTAVIAGMTAAGLRRIPARPPVVA